MIFGSVFSLGMMAYKIENLNNKALGLQDRVYRIHKNAGQVRTDIFAGAGFISTFALGYLTTGSFYRSFGFSSFGITAAILAHVATK